MTPTHTERDRQWLAWLITVALIVVSTVLGIKLPDLPPPPLEARGHTGLTGLEVVAPTDQPTATPAVISDNYGVSNIHEFRDSATPVAYYANSGSYEHLVGTLGLSFSDLTVTVNHQLTPAYTVYGLDSSAAVSITLAACGNDGQLLVLIGDDANAITVNDANIRTSDGNALTINQYDVAMLVCMDTEWIEALLLANQ